MLVTRLVVAAAITAAASLPAAAQVRRSPDAYTRGYYPWHTARAEAISRSTAAETADANARAAAELGDGGYGDRYSPARHRAEDDGTMREHRRGRLSGGAQHVRRQRAYAMAMDAWRAQVDACENGVREACYAPTPDPAEYM